MIGLDFLSLTNFVNVFFASFFFYVGFFQRPLAETVTQDSRGTKSKK